MRQVVVTAAVAGVVGVSAYLGAGPAEAEGSANGEATPVVVVAAPGDTVWTLALPHAPAGADPHAFVAKVASRNDVDPARLQAGDVLRIPSD